MKAMVTLNNEINAPIKIFTRRSWNIMWLMVFLILNGVLFSVAFADQTSKQTPRIKIKLPKTPIFENTNYTFEFEVTDAQNRQKFLIYSWRLDNNEWSPFSSETSVILNADALTVAVHRFQVRVKDEDGKIKPTSSAVVFEVVQDLQPPIFLIGSENPLDRFG